MKKLIYFTLDNNLNYIELAKMCVQSLYHNGYKGDFLFITNLENEILKNINFNNNVFFLKINNKGLLNSAANKLNLFLFDKLKNYDKIIFSDLDIIWTSSPDNIFNIINDDVFYISNENSLMSENWWGANILNDDEKKYINENNILGLNSGVFAFNKSMINHLKEINIFFNKNLNLVNSCLEQPFINVYLFRNKIYNTILNDFVSHAGYNTDTFFGTALHFAGGPGNFPVKYDKMKIFFNKNFPSD
jgi:hypothetical protein